jgi:flagellar biogenesis protein FliO
VTETTRVDAAMADPVAQTLTQTEFRRSGKHMVEQLMSDYGSRFVIAVLGVGFGLVFLVAVLWLVRRRSGPSPFLRGGKNRQPRLQVLDAAAVDARRRIVLVRRDDVEHLVMIGGPTDVVIESGIRPLAEQRALRDDQVLAQQPAEPRLEAATRQPAISAPPRQIASQPIQAPEFRNSAEAVETSRDVRPAPRAAARPAPSIEPAPTPAAKDAAPVASPRSSVELAKAGDSIEPPVRRAAPVSDRRREPDMPQATASAAEKPTQEQPTPDTSAADLGAASDALDIARRRVLQSGSLPTDNRTRAAATPSAPPLPFASTSASANIPAASMAQGGASERPLGSAFDRILEEEMASNLAANHDERPGASPAPASMTARRDPVNPRVTGATPEPSLQTEIARIFGEMSVTRDDR